MQAVTNAPDRLMKRGEVAELIGLSTSSFDRMTAGGKTPKPVSIAGASVRFRASDIARWIEHGCPARAEFDALTAPAKGGKR